MPIEPIMLDMFETEPSPSPPEYHAGDQAATPVASAWAKVALMRSSISSFSPNATAHTVRRSGVVIQGRRDFVFSTASSTEREAAISNLSVFR